MNKNYELPEEIHEMFLDGAAAEECRDECIRSWFKAGRAVFYAKKARRAYSKAWELVYELWPEVREGKWQYNFKDKALKKREI